MSENTPPSAPSPARFYATAPEDRVPISQKVGYGAAYVAAK